MKLTYHGWVIVERETLGMEIGQTEVGYVLLDLVLGLDEGRVQDLVLELRIEFAFAVGHQSQFEIS